MYPKLASHKFCNSLMARHHKVRTTLAASPYLVPSSSSLLPPALATHAACVQARSRFASWRCRWSAVRQSKADDAACVLL